MGYVIILVVTLILPNSSAAQWGRARDKRQAREYYQQAVQRYEFQQYDEARNLAVKALRKDEQMMNAYLLIGEAWEAQRNTQKTVSAYNQCLRADATFWPCRWRLAINRQRNGDYQEAARHFRTLARNDNLPEKYRKHLAKKQRAVDTAIALKARPLPYNLENLGGGVNASSDEYWPALTADESCIFFTRRVTRQKRFGERTVSFAYEDIYSSCRTDSGWSNAQAVTGRLNSREANEGAIALSANGEKMIFTICSSEMGHGSCDLYISKLTSSGWSEPRNLGPPINTSHKETQPSLSPDGETLYFASNRPGGFGNMDIWRVALSSDTKTKARTEPENLGQMINTDHDDRSPFIHPDNSTLYFSSDGWPGMGRGDLFYSRKNENGTFEQPTNLGYPINNHEDQVALFVAADGQNAYLATRADSLSSYGGVDIYSFELPKSKKPAPVIYLKGKVLDKKLMTPLAAEVKILDLETRNTIRTVETEAANGKFLFTLPAGANYLLHVKSPDHLFFSDHLDLRDQPAYQPYKQNVLLSRLQSRAQMVLRNVFFDTDSFRLKPYSYPELKAVADMLQESPGVNIKIGGHTDDVGSDSYNEQLSEKRARSVYKYLVAQQGIAPERLSYQGYGSSQSMVPNTSERNRARNRRITIEVISAQ